MSQKIDTTRVLGLNSKEETILKVVMSSPMSVSDIARHSKIPRTSLLYMLKKLCHRGLVAREKRGKRILWKSNSFVASKKISNQDIVIYQGVRSIFQIFEKWTSLPKNTRIAGIQPDKSLRQSLRKNNMADFVRVNESVKRNKIIFEGIVHEKSTASIISEMGKDKARKVFDSFVGRLEDYIKIPNEFADVESEIYLFKGATYIINWDKEIAIGIHDKDMVDLLMAMFLCVKEVGTRYNQGEKMKQSNDTLKTI